MDQKTSKPSDIISDKEILRKILSEKENDELVKEKLYRIIYEESLVDEVSMDTDLIDECVKTINYIEGKEEYLSEEKITKMRQNVDQQYKKWSTTQRRMATGKRIVQVVATFILIFFTSTVVANAFGYNLIQSAVNWGKDTFNLSTQNQSNEEKGNRNIAETSIYSSIQEAMTDIPSNTLLPQWLPDGYVFKYAEKISLENNNRIFFYFENDDKKIIIFSLNVYSENQKTMADINFEKDENLVEIYDKNSVPHYILQNLGQTQAIWSYYTTIYNINGDVSVGEMIKIIDSMYVGS